MNQVENREKIIQNHDKIDNYVCLFFTIFDIIIYFIILCIFGCFNRELLSIKQNISFLFLLDICIRIINIFYDTFVYFSFAKEILSTVFASVQFYFIITILNQIFKENSNGIALDKGEIKYPFLSSILFFIFTITFQYNKTLYLVQYFCTIIAIFIYAYHIKKRIDMYLYILEQKKKYTLNNFIHNFTIVISSYYVIFYILKITSIFVENMLYYSYLEITIDMVKELTKYITFMMVIYFYYLHNKYSDNNQKEASVKINNISSISSSSFPA